MNSTFSYISENGSERIGGSASDDSIKVGRALLERFPDRLVQHLIRILSYQILRSHQLGQERGEPGGTNDDINCLVEVDDHPFCVDDRDGTDPSFAEDVHNVKH